MYVKSAPWQISDPPGLRARLSKRVTRARVGAKVGREFRSRAIGAARTV